MNHTPLVSVIMPLYNSEKFLSESILCIINQTYPNWELIIVNDGSTDNSLKIAEKFASEKIKIYNQENKGQCAANNFGFSLSKGEFIKFFDSDDLLSLNMLEEQVKIIVENPRSIISAKWGRFYDNYLSTFKLVHEEVWQDLSSVNWICTSWINAKAMLQCGIWLVPRATIEKAGLWDESLTVINDLEFFTRLILNSENVKFSDMSIVYYRSGNSGTLSGKYGREAMLSCFKSMDLSIGYLLDRSQTDIAKQCAANVWQSFIYMCYPDSLDLVKKAQEKIDKLVAPNLPYSKNKIQAKIIKIIGWRNFKLIQNIKRKLIN